MTAAVATYHHPLISLILINNTHMHDTTSLLILESGAKNNKRIVFILEFTIGSNYKRPVWGGVKGIKIE